MMKPATRAWRPAAALLAGLTSLLSACGTAPPTRFHSLLPVPSPASARVMPVQTARAWDLMPVSLPAQVDTPQWVVRQADETFVILEHDRWIAPLADEIRAAVALRLGAADAAAPAGGTAVRRWQIAIEVRRLDAEWTLRASDGQGGEGPRCQGQFEQAVGAGLDALGAGQRSVFAQLGDALAASLAPARHGAAPGCQGRPAP